MNNKNRKTMQRLSKVLAVILALSMILMTAFYLIAMLGSNQGSALCYVYASETAEGSGENQKKQLGLSKNLELLNATLLFIKENYKDSVTYDRLVQVALNAMIDELGDEYSEYYVDSSIGEMMSNVLDSSYGGVGITVVMLDGKLTASEVNLLGPAYTEGIKKGDVIDKINGKYLTGLSIEECAELLRGKSGTYVGISVLRDKEKLEFKIKRADIPVSSIEYEMKDYNTGYINIVSFSSQTGTEFKRAKAELIDMGAKNLIVDVRDNGGGYISAAIDIAKQLIGNGTVCHYYQQGKITETVKSKANGQRKVPTVLLINENSASASELLAAALKENDTATIIGKNSYGKGVAQTTINLVNGDSIKLSTFYFLSPKKHTIDKVGVSPQIEISNYSEDGTFLGDKQLEKALESLN